VAEPGAEQTDDSGWDDHTGNGQTSNDWSGPDEETAEVGSDTDTAVTRDEENTASDAAEEDTDEGAWQFTGGEG
jgi:hypothetical protein